ncbi:glycosyltransferase family 39 protein [Thalassospira profundimaris]|uniref:ArnT family glycosyltransferase n=1 Tax=Thalassospira profundimaris TaxID=502049 RepID=UPI001C688382|nr:glycosyltransferase family 39 protein [Thalassospira profundimaris]
MTNDAAMDIHVRKPGVTPLLSRFRPSGISSDLILPLVLFFMGVIAYLPGLWQVPPLDRDEPRFTQATKQMLETNQYIDIRFQDQPRYKKPVGIYWLQSAAVLLTGHDAKAPLWVYRLPSFVGGILAILLTYWVARAFCDPKTSFIAALFVGSTIILGVEARLAKTDTSLLWTILWAQGALARLWLHPTPKPDWRLAFCFWTALALGILIKGPIAPMVVGFTVLGLCLIKRDITWLKSATPLYGFLWLCVLILPWFFAIAKLTDYSFFQESLGHDLLGKVVGGQESHGKPPGMHLVFMFFVFWPLTGFFVLALPHLWRSRSQKMVQFCACWFVPSWIVFELTGTKLPHYTMPLLPALAICVTASLWNNNTVRQTNKYLAWGSAIVLTLPAVLLPIATIVLPLHLKISPSVPGVGVSILAAVLAIIAAIYIIKHRVHHAMPFAIIGAIIMSTGFWGFVAPSLSPIWISSRLVAAISKVAPCPYPAVAIAGFNEPSFIFLEGTHTRVFSGAQAADFLSTSQVSVPADALAPAASLTNTCRVAAIESHQKAAFVNEADKMGLVIKPSASVQGLNINGGHHMNIDIYVNSRR